MTMRSTIAVAMLLAPLASSLRLMGSRREFVAAAVSAVPSAAFATGNMPAVQGEATKMDSSVKAAKTPEAAKTQISAGLKTIDKLLAEFDQVTAAGGGDGVRRQLGTVGTESPLYLIEPAFRLLFEADDSLPMEYIDTLEGLMLNLSASESEACECIARSRLLTAFMNRAADPHLSCARRLGHLHRILVGEGQTRGLLSQIEGGVGQGARRLSQPNGLPQDGMNV